MKSLFWIILALLVPLSATAQSRLFIHATIDMPMTGWSDDVNGGCFSDPGPTSSTIEVSLNDTLPLIAGENHDTLTSAIMDWGQFYPYLSYSGNYTFQFDSHSHTLHNLQITAAGLYGPDPNNQTENINFAISLDSISLGVVSDPNWTLAEGSSPCSYSVQYSDYGDFTIDGSGGDTLSGQGPTTLVAPNTSTASVDVSTGGSSSSIQITYLSNGAVEIERSTSDPAEVVEIFDALGRITDRATIDGNVARISNLHPGLYFARLGDQVAKFVVPPR